MTNFWMCHLSLVLLLTINILILASTVGVQDNISLLNFSNLNSLKLLRNDLINHIKEVQGIVQILDSLAFEEVKNISQSEILNQAKVNLLVDEVQNIQKNISELSFDISQNINDTRRLRERYRLLQNDLDSLKHQLDYKTCESLNLLQLYFDGNFSITAIYKNLSEEMPAILKKIVTKEDIVKSNLCINIIKKGEYIKAVFLLNTIDDLKKINYIVKEVYNGDLKNFNKVLNFGDKVRNITKSLLVYKALYNEIHNSHSNEGGLEEILKLYQSLKREILEQLLIKDNLKREAISLQESLKTKLKVFGKQTLKKERSSQEEFSEEYCLTARQYTNLYKIFAVDMELFASICSEVFSELNAMPLEDVFYSYGDYILEEKFSELFTQLIRVFHEDVMKLLHFFKHLLTLSEEENMRSLVKKHIEDLKNDLSESIKNVEFANTVCIFNYGLQEYLDVSDIRIRDDKQPVRTTDLLNDKGLMITWKIKRFREDWYNIMGTKSNYTYLCTNDEEYYKSNGHFVFLCHKNEIIHKGPWQIIPKGDYCYIKHVELNEYLFASEETHYFAHTGDIDYDSDYWKWLIEDCSHENDVIIL